MSKIQKELADVTGIKPAEGEKITDVVYLKRLLKGVADLDDKDWNGLSKTTKAWFNDAADAANAKKEIPVYPDYEEPKEDEAPRRRRAAAEEDDAPAKTKAYTPKKGDTVKVVTKRGKEAEGKVVDPDDKGELVLMVDGEEVGYALDRLESVELVGGQEEAPKRRRAAEEDDAPADPKKGDTVEIETKRGKKVVGNIVEIDDSIVVVKTASGDEEEFDKDRVASIVVKVTAEAGGRGKPTKGDEDEAPKRRGSKDEGEAEGKPARVGKDANAGVSVGNRARELMCEDPLEPLDLEGLKKALKKEDLSFNESTIKMVHADCLKLFTMLKASKHLK